MRISCWICEPTDFCFNVFVIIVFVSTTGMFEYRFVMSSEAKVKYGSSGVSLRFPIRSVVFFYVEGIMQWRYVIEFVCEQSGQFVSRSVGPIHHGPDRLVRFVYFISPLMEGAEGFMLIYFHLVSCGIRVLLSFTVFLIWAWKSLVVSMVAVRKLLLCNSESNLVLYCGQYNYRISFVCACYRGIACCNLVSINFISLASGCVLCVVLEMCCRCSFSMPSATNFPFIGR
jgi:hypothetical protein